MTDRPIIFSVSMVRALIAGRKYQTRRLLNPQPTELHGEAWDYRGARWSGVLGVYCPTSGPSVLDMVRWSAGDRLRVKESIYYGNDSNWYFEADKTGIGVDGCMAVRHFKRNKAPGMFLPRVASRLTLTVTDVRVQRLQEINEEDAQAEGCGLYVPGHGFITYDELRDDPGYSNFLSPRMGFEATWVSLHGDGSWDGNPWIVALTFTTERRNIDTLFTPSRPLSQAAEET